MSDIDPKDEERHRAKMTKLKSIQDVEVSGKRTVEMEARIVAAGVKAQRGIEF
ncbi:hypothetical protein [Mesorhizobium sp. 2RAF21]|uniref:hypothetical protein n=1 Tax=Mesorhizobium sp. 2RAF21 TaxID=3232995 RepID=UPI003F9562D1